MTKARIAQVRKVARVALSLDWFKTQLGTALDEIERLQAQVKDANKAIKLAMKGRK